ncbi:hypothetical protein [Streptomyces murinus]|uniref:hypothetical protein n=1 Tax=Streptomyces murinus TaxID=33900 RepID=UPI00382A6923
MKRTKLSVEVREEIGRTARLPKQQVAEARAQHGLGEQDAFVYARYTADRRTVQAGEDAELYRLPRHQSVGPLQVLLLGLEDRGPAAAGTA